MKVVCITGMPGCGKEEFLKVAVQKGFVVVRMGDIVREEALKHGLPMTDRAVGTFADEERKKHGYGVWAERTFPRVNSELNLIDGVRGSAETEVYRTAFPGKLYIVAVLASPTIRFARIQERRRADDPMTESEFKVRDARELSWGLGEVISNADFKVENEGDLEGYRESAEEVLDIILKEE